MPRQSWGVIHPNGTVILRVWRDRIATVEGRRLAQLTHLEKDVHRKRSWSYKERQEQVEAIRQGARCYLILCAPKDSAAKPNKRAQLDIFNDSKESEA